MDDALFHLDVDVVGRANALSVHQGAAVGIGPGVPLSQANAVQYDAGLVQVTAGQAVSRGQDVAGVDQSAAAVEGIGFGKNCKNANTW